MDDQEIQAYTAYLVEKGAMIPTGEIDPETGEELHTFNAQLMEIYAPAVWQEILRETDETLLKLYNLGLVSVEYNENLEAVFTLTDLGREVIENG